MTIYSYALQEDYLARTSHLDAMEISEILGIFEEQ